ncbi:phospholipid scramblase 1-like [Ruditapes philippinarum]|uniref:phospholipid scramblase 1-like n=1 Tax=Ruditapes philippinarum TaxID=129788 RepID=UPI00295BC078|nr:phospholipid scramblase 1-like [Ruditapes philippinarum]XP_060588605.1 phospholipid scramblase 1-like [Ruditapes philippinarum]
MSAPISNQPQQMQMGVVQQGGGLPPSLQYLAGLDQIIVKQKIEALEVLTGFETRNRYAVLNNQGQQIFFVQEESSLCERCFCPMNRGLTLHMTDNNSQEVMQFRREFKFCTGCCWCGEGCCNMQFTVESPVGRQLGSVRTGDSKCKAHMKVYDASDKHMFTLWGPCCPCQCVCGCTDDINFPITDPSLTTQVGNVAKQWRGCCVDTFTDADQFCLTFPADMTVECKALLIGALFLAEFYVFEQQKNNNGGGAGY